jgi:signal transduction histidine kinase
MRAGEDPGLMGELRRQQMLLLTQQLPVMATVNTLNALLVTGLFVHPTSRTAALVWLGVILLASAFQLRAWLKVRGKPVPATVSGKSLERARILSGAVGFAWGCIAFFLWRDGNIYSEMFIVLVIAGMAAGTTSLLNPIPKVANAFLLAILAPLWARLFWEGGAMHYVIAALAAVFAFALIVGSQRSYKHMVELIRSSRAMQSMRADLGDAIEATSDAIGHFDADMKLIAANRRFNEWFKDPLSVSGDTAEGRIRAVGNDRWVVSKLLPTTRGGFVSVHTDITDLKVREEEIEAARLAAEEGSRAKSAFIEQVGATLRAPMEEVVAFLSRETDDEGRSDAAAQAVKVLEAVSDIADIATIDSQSYEYRFVFADAKALVEWAAQAASARYGKRRSAKVQINVHDEITDLVCDERALKRALMHLIVNALENTPEDKDVGVDVRKAFDGQAEICVWDYGQGFDPALLERVQRHANGLESAALSDLGATQGIGLGLRIVSQVVQRHRGSLKILSEPTLGTFAYVKLPYRTSFYAAPETLEAANDAEAAADAARDRSSAASASA